MMQMHYFYEMRGCCSIHRDAEKGSSRRPAPLFYAASCMSIRPVLRAVTRSSAESANIGSLEEQTQRAIVSGG